VWVEFTCGLHAAAFWRFAHAAGTRHRVRWPESLNPHFMQTPGFGAFFFIATTVACFRVVPVFVFVRFVMGLCPFAPA
jgi:hypothetical protein